MSGVQDGFVTAFLIGFLTNLGVAAASLVFGAIFGAPLARLRLDSRWLGRPAAALTGLLRASPTFVVMFVLLNMIPSELQVFGIEVQVPAVAILILSLSVYAAVYVSDNFLDALRHSRAGSATGALLFIPNMLRCFTVLVMASSTGAAIGVHEAVTITLQQADRLPSVGGRIGLILAVILFFASVMQLTRLCSQWLTGFLTAAQSGYPVQTEAAAPALLGQALLQRTTQFGWMMVLVVAPVGIAAMFATFPPKSITIETGPIGGSYYNSAAMYRDYLEARGIGVRLHPVDTTSGIIFDVNEHDSDADAGFADRPVDPDQIPNVTYLGSTEYEPLFAFARRSAPNFSGFASLRGLRIGFPPRGSATAATALSILSAFGLSPDDANFSFRPLADELEALKSGDVDLAFVMQGADNPQIAALARREDLRMVDFPQAPAIARHFPSLHEVVVPAASYDLPNNVPLSDLHLVANTTQVIVKKDMHPAIAYLLLQAMTEIHRAPGIISRDAEFPALRHSRIPANEYAREYYQSGIPWIYKNLPLWLASVIGYYIVLLVPLFVLMPVYNWLALPQVPDILGWLRSLVWLRTLREIEAGQKAGRPLSRADLATLRLIQTSLDRPDKTSDCRQLLRQIMDRRREIAATPGNPAEAGPVAE